MSVTHRYLIAPVRRALAVVTPSSSVTSGSYASLDTDQLIGPFDLDELETSLPRFIIRRDTLRIGQLQIPIPRNQDRALLNIEVARLNELYDLTERRLVWYRGVFERIKCCTRSALRHLLAMNDKLRHASDITRRHVASRLEQFTITPLARDDFFELLSSLFDGLTMIRTTPTHT